MDAFGRAPKCGLIFEAVDPWVDLVAFIKEHGQAVLGADACPIKIFKEGTIIW